MSQSEPRFLYPSRELKKMNNLRCEPALQFIPSSWHVIMEAKLGVTSAVLCRR